MYDKELQTAKIKRKINETKTIKKEMIDKLNPSYVYVEVDGYSLPKKVEIESKMKDVG